MRTLLLSGLLRQSFLWPPTILVLLTFWPPREALAQSPAPANAPATWNTRPPGQEPSPPNAPATYPYPYPYQPPPPPAPGTDKHVGVGYKIGNGLGFRGADIIVSPVPHVALDLQGNWLSSGSASGFGVAPGLQLFLRDKGQSTPYFAVGYIHIKLTLQDVTASGNGFFANLGYEWKWASGIGIVLGGGVGYITNITATNGLTTIQGPKGAHPNIEAGLRYLFL